MLVAAQNALYIEQACEERPKKLSKQELKDLVNEEIATDAYDIGSGEGQCTRKTVKRALRQYFQREYKCHYKFDECGVRPREDKLETCLSKNEDKMLQKLEDCIETESEVGPEDDEHQEDEQDEGEQGDGGQGDGDQGDGGQGDGGEGDGGEGDGGEGDGG